MRKLIYITLLFSSCTGAWEEESPTNPCALYAVFEAGQTPTADIVCAYTNTTEANRLEWLWTDGSSSPFVEFDNHWELSGNRFPQPGESVVLRWEREESITDVSLQFPPQIDLNSQSADTLLLALDESVDVQWTDLGEDYEYVLSLECMEDNPEPISQQAGNFNTVHAGPQLGNSLSLEAQNFTFRGVHRLVIYALNRAFTSVYFDDPSDIRGLLKMPTGNLTGENGYVMCVTTLKVQIVVE